MRDQRVGYFGEGRLNRFLVLDQRAFPLGFGQLHVGLEAAGGKDRLRDLRNEAPGAVRAGEQRRELRALSSQESREADLWKIGGFGYANLSVRRDQRLLRRANVGTPFQ